MPQQAVEWVCQLVEEVLLHQQSMENLVTEKTQISAIDFIEQMCYQLPTESVLDGLR